MFVCEYSILYTLRQSPINNYLGFMVNMRYMRCTVHINVTWLGVGASRVCT